VAVYENDTDVTDADDIPAHSLWIVVEGGAVADIVESMVKKQKLAAKGMVGAVTGTFTESVLRPDGSTFTIVHSMTFDRPVDVPVLVRLDATFVDVNLPIDDESIRQEIATKKFNIGINLKTNALYSLAFNSGENFVPTNLEISRDAGTTWTGGILLAALNEKFSIDSDDVAVTEVIPS